MAPVCAAMDGASDRDVHALTAAGGDAEHRAAHLRGAAGGVHEHHGALAHIGRVQGADEELIVGLVDRVPTLQHTWQPVCIGSQSERQQKGNCGEGAGRHDFRRPFMLLSRDGGLHADRQQDDIGTGDAVFDAGQHFPAHTYERVPLLS